MRWLRANSFRHVSNVISYVTDRSTRGCVTVVRFRKHLPSEANFGTFLGHNAQITREPRAKLSGACFRL